MITPKAAHTMAITTRLATTTPTPPTRLPGAALDHVQQPCWAGAVMDRGEVDDNRDVLVATSRLSPDVLIHADDPDSVEAVLVVDEDPLAFGQDGVIGGVPGDREPFGDAGNGQVLDHDALQRPPQPESRELGSWFGGLRGVLAPHVSAAGAPIAAHRDHHGRRSPPERLVRQPPDHGDARHAFAAARTAPLGRAQRLGTEARPSLLNLGGRIAKRARKATWARVKVGFSGIPESGRTEARVAGRASQH